MVNTLVDLAFFIFVISKSEMCIKIDLWSNYFPKTTSCGKHIIQFKGGLRNINATASGSSKGNYTFAGPYGWDYPVTYHLTITKS